jgi:hypothetical protein
MHHFDARLGLFLHFKKISLKKYAMISLCGEPGTLLLARAQGVELVPQDRIVGERFVLNEAL